MKLKSGSFKQRMVLGLIFVLIFSYTFYHLSSLFGEDISTFAAGVTTETTVLNYNGYIFRDETVLTSEYAGVVDYSVENGTKVSKGQMLATVYEYGDAQAREHIRRLDSQIALLEKSTGSALDGLDMGEVKQTVSATYYNLIKLLAEGEPGALSYQADKLLVGLNQMSELAKGENASGNQTLEKLRNARKTLLNNGGNNQTYSAEASGYFYTATDGYETDFTMEAANNLTGESFYRLISNAANSNQDGQTAYGKICYDSEWILVFPVAIEEQSYFEAGQTHIGIFEENNQTEIPLTVERIIEVPEQGTALIVFRADRLPEYFSFDRCQNLRVEVENVSGIYVPKDIVERIDGFRGVYILRGSVVYFRYIEILYEGNDYYLVKEGVENDEARTYLKVNDLIILNGRNMFDGRVLD